MKVARYALAVLLALALAQIALAQQGPGPMAPQGKSATPEKFEDRKARILKMLEERRAHIDKTKACVEAAKSDDDLEKCRPERPMGMGPGGMHRGGMQGGGPGMMRGGGQGGQQAPMPPANQ